MLVDDGSSDVSVALAEAACAGRLPFRLVAQPNPAAHGAGMWRGLALLVHDRAAAKR